MLSFFQMLRRQPRWLGLLQAVVLIGLIGWFDWVTGWEWSFFAPYAVPIVLVVWLTDWGFGFGFAALCAVTFWVAHCQRNPYQSGWAFALAVGGWWFYFSVLVVAVAALKAQRELDRARIDTLERMQLLEREILAAGEHERQRIGRDLHDGLGPHLAALSYAAAFLENELGRRDQPEAVQAARIRELASAAVAHARDLARGICPIPLDGPGLVIALEDLARTVSRQTGMAVSFQETGDPQVADSERGMHLYRIAQEALTNAAKHGGASTATVVLSTGAASLRLAVTDDGKGLAAPPDSPPGMGLPSMRYRAQLLGSELKIDSNPDAGTTVSCEVSNHPPPSPTPTS